MADLGEARLTERENGHLNQITSNREENKMADLANARWTLAYQMVEENAQFEPKS